jgi:hypothetical protein
MSTNAPSVGKCTVGRNLWIFICVLNVARIHSSSVQPVLTKQNKRGIWKVTWESVIVQICKFCSMWTVCYRTITPVGTLRTTCFNTKKCILPIYMVCSKSSWNLSINQLCIGYIRCLSDLAAWPLIMQAILFYVDQMFRLFFIIGFVIECVVVFSMQLIKEQRICVKFCFIVAKQLQKPTTWYGKLMMMMPASPLPKKAQQMRSRVKALWTEGSWLLHHDNAPAHAALSIREFLAKHSVPTLSQPPCSPDLSSQLFYVPWT